MISAEAPILFAKGCDIFITELTMRAWIHAEENKRRTLQRSDIASALAKSDMFDFLIDIVPREEASHARKPTGQGPPTSGVPGAPPGSTQLPPQQSNIPPQAGHPAQHTMPPDYSIGPHGLAQEHDYRPNMYSAQVQPGPAPPYGGPQQQMYGEMEGIYGYPPMQAQQVRFLLSSTCIQQLTFNSKCITCNNSDHKTRQWVQMQATITHVMMVMRMRKVSGMMRLAKSRYKWVIALRMGCG